MMKCRMTSVCFRSSTACKEVLKTFKNNLRYIPSVRGHSSNTAAVTDVKAARPLEDIPGPKSLPLIGTLYNYLPWGNYDFRRTHKTGTAMFKKYGPIVRDEIVPGRIIIRLFDPNDIAIVCQHQGKYPQRVVLHPLKRYRDMRGLHGGLATMFSFYVLGSSGTEWHRYRSLVNQNMMRPSEVATYIPAQEQVSDDFVQRIRLLRNKDNEIPEFLYELYRWACESIGVVCFDQRVGTIPLDGTENQDGVCFIANCSKMFEAMHKSLFMSFIHNRGIETQAWRDLCDAFDSLWEYTVKLVDIAEKTATNKDSLLMKLLSTPDLHRVEALVMISDLFAGGVDTTAHTLAFNLYHLARNPDKQHTLYEEIMTVMSPGQPLDGNMINHMSYLRAVIKETSRLTPTVVPGTMRLLDTDVVLSGYRVPAGLAIHFHNDVISRLPEYFPNPDQFIPERWLRSNTAKRKDWPIHPYASLPFGVGSRMCIGRRFAEQEIALGLIKILQNFTVKYEHDDIGQVLRLVNMPDKPLRFAFTDRHS